MRLLAAPMPLTEHPSLVGYADGIRQFINKGERREVVIPVPRSIARFRNDSMPSVDDQVRTVTLNVYKVAAPAPFVGDPRRVGAMYVWFVAQDAYGRHVAADAQLVYFGVY